jgi:hypothetical protein
MKRSTPDSQRVNRVRLSDELRLPRRLQRSMQAAANATSTDPEFLRAQQASKQTRRQAHKLASTNPKPWPALPPSRILRAKVA